MDKIKIFNWCLLALTLLLFLKPLNEHPNEQPLRAEKKKERTNKKKRKKIQKTTKTKTKGNANQVLGTGTVSAKL